MATDSRHPPGPSGAAPVSSNLVGTVTVSQHHRGYVHLGRWRGVQGRVDATGTWPEPARWTAGRTGGGHAGHDPIGIQGRARRDAAAFYLTQLARGLQGGELRILTGGRHVDLATTEALALHIVVRLKRRDNQMEITVRWPRRPLIRGPAGARPPARSPPGIGPVSERGDLSYDGRLSPAEAAELLVRLAQALRTGQVSVSLGREEITVAPAGALRLRIDGVQKRVKSRVEIGVAWARGPGDPGSADVDVREDLPWPGTASGSTVPPPPEEIAARLIELAGGLRQGLVSLPGAGRTLRLPVPAEVTLELEIKDRDDRGRITVQLSWKREAHAPPHPHDSGPD
jgi:amphi-Trp domain-containing protein